MSSKTPTRNEAFDKKISDTVARRDAPTVVKPRASNQGSGTGSGPVSDSVALYLKDSNENSPVRRDADEVSKVSVPPLDRATIGRYEVIYPVAVGGMAGVHVGRLHGIAGFERLVAIKVIHPHLAAEESFVRMFLDEARLAAGIHHPNVGEIFEVGEDNGVHFMVGELILGKDLRRVARAARRQGVNIPKTVYADTISQVCRGLHEAHELRDGDGEMLNLIHRDISSHNVLVSYKGYVKLIDFGVAWARNRLSHTEVGSAKGKIGFMAPEQLRGERLDRRSDIFSLGVVLYIAITGKQPFPGDSEGERLNKILEGDFKKPREVREDIDEDIEGIILKAMALSVEDRYATAAAMGDALDEYVKKYGTGDEKLELARLMENLFARDIENHKQQIRQHREKMGEFSGVVGLSGRERESGSEIPQIAYYGQNGVPPAPLHSTSPPRAKRLLLTAASIVLGGLLVAAFFVLLDGTGEERPFEKRARAEIENGSDIPSTGENGKVMGAAIGGEIPETVAIELLGLVKGVVVTLDGKQVELPLSLPGSNTPSILRVTAPGYSEFEKAIVPNRDQTIAVELKKMIRGSAQFKKKWRSKRMSEEKETLDEGWEANPFQ